MVEKLSPEKRSRIMKAIKGHDTGPERTVRKLVLLLGYRYRLRWSALPGHPDLIFPGRRKVIFVHGCFWHSHEGCQYAHIPGSDFWRLKLSRNRQRDQDVIERLTKIGWKILVIWECELLDLDSVKAKIAAFLQD